MLVADIGGPVELVSFSISTIEVRNSGGNASETPAYRFRAGRSKFEIYCAEERRVPGMRTGSLPRSF